MSNSLLLTWFYAKQQVLRQHASISYHFNCWVLNWNTQPYKWIEIEENWVTTPFSLLNTHFSRQKIQTLHISMRYACRKHYSRNNWGMGITACIYLGLPSDRPYVSNINLISHTIKLQRPLIIMIPYSQSNWLKIKKTITRTRNRMLEI